MHFKTYSGNFLVTLSSLLECFKLEMYIRKGSMVLGSNREAKNEIPLGSDDHLLVLFSVHFQVTLSAKDVFKNSDFRSLSKYNVSLIFILCLL